MLDLDPDKTGSQTREQTDFATVDIDKLASVNENVSVPHTAIEKMQIKKGMGGYSFWIEYRTEDGKKQFASADLNPSKQYLKARKAEGADKQEAIRQYAEKAQEVFRRALPPVAAGKAVWLP